MNPLRLIGYWKSNFEHHRHALVYPNPKDFIDETWDENTRQKVIDYLDNGVLHHGTRGFSTCRICGCPNGTSELTDGVFIWPDGLSHYLKEHQVRLPSYFVEHCLTYTFNKEQILKDIEEGYDDGTFYERPREGWWKAHRNWKVKEYINWTIEPDIYEDEEDILILIGFWEGDQNPLKQPTKYPHPKYFIDKSWDENVKKQVLAYIRTCTIVESEPVFSHDKCLFTGEQLSNRVLSDGHFLFPENYIHYIEHHDIRPLDYFVRHCIQHQNTWEDNVISIHYDLEIDWWEDFRVY